MRPVLVAVAALAAVAMPAAAAEFQSAYTDINLDDCLVMESDDFGTSWACPGYKGMPVYVAESDLRFFLSYGFGADKEPAAEQTLPPFNYLGPKVEWRLTNASGGWRPFATIVRYFVGGGEGAAPGQVLVVTRIEPGATCHTAYIDALANTDANELARKAADARKAFACDKDDPEIVGNFKAW